MGRFEERHPFRDIELLLSVSNAPNANTRLLVAGCINLDIQVTPGRVKYPKHVALQHPR
jgi:hypothetical protein